MAGYTKKSLREVENQAPTFGMPEEMDARFARTALGGKTLGLSLLKLAPAFRMPFGHKHVAQEEVYVVVRGSGRIKVDDEIVEVAEWDAIRFDEDTMRNVEAGRSARAIGRSDRRRIQTTVTRRYLDALTCADTGGSGSFAQG